MNSDRTSVVAVIIGRNEGERLRNCLRSVRPAVDEMVYVDSGSTDNSVALARSLGADVVELDDKVPFTAARGRNAGVAHAVRRFQGVAYILFIDGDCTLDELFVRRAMSVMAQDGRVAVVCGRRRERHPTASIYNLLCDIEWNTPIGTANACGGDSLVRRSAFEQVEGFEASLIAGEEPEMCLRLRQEGWRIERIDATMTVHDANLHSFWQWWRRAVRAGYAYMDGYLRHRGEPERYRVREIRSILVWALVVPLICMSLAPVTVGVSLLGLGVYALLWLRIFNANLRRCGSSTAANVYAGFCILGKWAHAWGVLSCIWCRWRGRQRAIIEYKTDEDARRPSQRKAA